MRGACLTGIDLYYARISRDDETYKTKLYKGKLPLKKITQVIKDLLMRKRIRLHYLLNTGG